MRVFYDIETSLAKVYTFRFRDANINHNQIIEPSKIICICWQKEGEKRIKHSVWDSKQNDKKCIEEFLKDIEGVTELIGHNSKSFDTKWVKGRCLVHGLTFPDCRELDTYRQAKKHFRLPHNRLADIAKVLGVSQKADPGGLSTWIDIDNGCDKALRRMIRYCKQDVKVLKEIHDKMLPLIDVVVHKGEERGDCASCGSADMVISNTRKTAAGMVRHQLKCKDCGRMQSISEKALRDWRAAR